MPSSLCIVILIFRFNVNGSNYFEQSNLTLESGQKSQDPYKNKNIHILYFFRKFPIFLDTNPYIHHIP